MPERRIFAKFTGPEILLEQGRLLYSMLHAMVRGGYSVLLLDNHPRETLGKYGAFVHDMPGLTLTASPPDDCHNWVYLYDKPERSIGKPDWRAQWRVNYDLFSPYWFSAPLIMPFPMHPQQAGASQDSLNSYRLKKRTMRIFFSGDSKDYHRNWVRYPKPKLSRQVILQTILERMGNEVLLLENPARLKAPDQHNFLNKCVIVYPGKAWIAAEDWLPTLAMSEFFLSPPGIVMPMCHNIVEAMAVGTIPITNYPEWFSPPLEHMRNCIVFDTQSDLIDKIKLAMQMPVAEVSRMKAHVIEYYETQLRPENFVRRIEARLDKKLTLLMYTERNMAQHAKHLGRYSVLFRDSALTTSPGWKAMLTATMARS